MKKIFIWMLAAILCGGLTTVVSSCGDDDVVDAIETINMVGKWTGSAQVSPTPGNSMEISFDGVTTFNSDYTYTTVDEDGSIVTGKWSLTKQTLKMTEIHEEGNVVLEYKIQDGWTRDRMVMTTVAEIPDETGKPVSYTFTITLNRVK